MHLQQLIHLPILLAHHSDRILSRMRSIPDEQLQEYWLASRMLMFRWCRQLQSLGASLREDNHHTTRLWCESHSVLREMLIHEITTRLCSTILEGIDSKYDLDRHNSVSKSIFCGQLDVRHRTLNVLIRAAEMKLPGTNQLNHDRRNLERWSDTLLGLLPACCPTRAYLSHPVSALNAKTMKSLREGDVRAILTLDIVSSLPAISKQETPNGSLHQRVADAVFACFSAALFDSGVMAATRLGSALRSSQPEQRADLDQWLPPASQEQASDSSGVMGRF